MAKEIRYFYTPNVQLGELPQDEAQHVLRVLRMGVGDELNLMDGQGTFYRAEITTATGHRCLYRIVEEQPQERAWNGSICLAMAPTKLNDRTEWFVEKATEIGIDEFAFLDCQFSERRTLKVDRIEKIVVSGMKQSHKAWKPLVDQMTSFKNFVETDRPGQKFICHCYDQCDIEKISQQDFEKDAAEFSKSCSGIFEFANGEKISQHKPHLKDVLNALDEPCTVLVGPEGDFSVDEVRLAQQHGYRSVSLGTSRLRTETAALVATHIMQLIKQK